jgi:hypothetical protein
MQRCIGKSMIEVAAASRQSSSKTMILKGADRVITFFTALIIEMADDPSLFYD